MMDAAEAWVKAMTKAGHQFAYFPCPRCDESNAVLIPPEGRVYDGFAQCSHCHGVLFRSVDHNGNVQSNVVPDELDELIQRHGQSAEREEN